MTGITNGYPKQALWPQDCLARAAEAVFETWHTHDAVVVARAALEAAIHDTAQLDALVEAQTTKSQPIAKFRRKAVQVNVHGQPERPPPNGETDDAR